MQMQPLLRQWHGFLDLKRQPQPWYGERLLEELAEQRAARTALERLSETADVLYVTSRAEHDGHGLGEMPAFRARHLVVYAYLVLKYTSRYAFYRVAARCCGCPDLDSVREVVNPARDHKLGQVARRNGIDAAKFVRVCRRLRRVWPLLP
ncbi:hypothetical protein OCS_01744 [Ophiocordyceps sinensis CO18]|uniref:Uncharacterized protein n=1 Tax=Ophiocordyceps sinensis (strain Co18 / CGMCC 3.14243) TaxID=911162 RepID=T5AL36_OPHSC|nr:hypothetical protein OCS_01744 [Ophiocordyceps sinensis CO18]